MIVDLNKKINEYKKTASMDDVIKRSVSKMNTNFILHVNGKQTIKNNTNLRCWWCTYQFKTSPCFIPIKYYNNKFHVFGCFCSYNCAAAYSLNLNDYKAAERHSLLKKLYSKVSGEPCENIKISPPKETLKDYGGTLTINQFRKMDVQ